MGRNGDEAGPDVNVFIVRELAEGTPFDPVKLARARESLAVSHYSYAPSGRTRGNRKVSERPKWAKLSDRAQALLCAPIDARRQIWDELKPGDLLITDLPLLATRIGSCGCRLDERVDELYLNALLLDLQRQLSKIEQDSGRAVALRNR
ncbi:MAG: hypothetical protein PHR51_00075 [Patescibacteria group bacterium]|nr:hypothetical protein [Patescibacteria group bacterium]